MIEVWCVFPPSNNVTHLTSYVTNLKSNVYHLLTFLYLRRPNFYIDV